MTKTVQNQVTPAHTHLNAPELMQLGQSAIKLLNEGDIKRGKGICIMTYVIAQAWYSKSFEALFTSPVSFTLEDIVMERGLEKSDGKKNNKLSAIRFNVIARDLFGINAEKKTNPKTGKEVITFFNASQKNSFLKASKLVKSLIDLQVRLYDDVQLDEKSNTLMLPQWVFFAKPTNTHFAATWEKTKNDIMPIGSYEDMLRNVDRIMIDRKLKEKRGTKDSKDPSVVLQENLINIASTARKLAMDIDTGKDGLTPTLKSQYMNTFLALKKLFEAEDKAEAKAKEDEQKEVKAKTAKAS